MGTRLIQLIEADPALRLAALLFWASFLICGMVAAARPDFTQKILGEAFIEQI